jgi:hypothetical protein
MFSADLVLNVLEKMGRLQKSQSKGQPLVVIIEVSFLPKRFMK